MFYTKIPFQEILHILKDEIIEHNKIDNETLDVLSTDSRELTGNEFFIALKGESFDAHQFIHSIIRKNEAKGIIYDSGEVSHEVPFLKVKDTNRFFQKLAWMHRKLFNPIVIGITGSNGKTSTKEITSYLLQQIFDSESVIKTEKNLNNHFGVPYTLFSINAQTKIAVIEMGMNHPGEIEILTKISEPDVCMITSISEGHAEFFNHTRDIAIEKFSILAGCRQTSRSVIHSKILDLYRDIFDQYNIENIVWDDFKKEFPYKETNYGIDFSIDQRSHQNKTIGVGIPAIHQRENFILSCAAIYHVFKIISKDSKDYNNYRTKLVNVLNTIEKLPEMEHRLVCIPHNDYEIWDDTYNANPDSFKKAIDFVSQRDGQGLFGIFGQMSELGELAIEKHYWLGQYASKKGFKHIIFASSEKKYRDAFRKGYNNKNLDLIEPDDNALKEGIQNLLRKIQGKGVILLKGSRSMRIERGIQYLT